MWMATIGPLCGLFAQRRRNMAIDLEARRRQLDILVGVWDTTITPLQPDGSPGEPSEAIDAYRWSANGLFLQHDVDADMAGERVLSMEILAVEPDSGRYVTRSYDADGSMNDFVAELDGREWRLTGEEQRFSGAFSPDGQRLEGEWEQRGNAGWSRLMRVSLRKRQ
jgi:hypothetical protein